MFGLIKVFSANMFSLFFFFHYQFKGELVMKMEAHTTHVFKNGNEKQLDILL
jgi:hypothetical protein